MFVDYYWAIRVIKNQKIHGKNMDEAVKGCQNQANQTGNAAHKGQRHGGDC